MALYRVRRDDGQEVLVEVGCTKTAEHAARNANNTEALAAIGDRGSLLAVRLVEGVIPGKANVLIKVWFDGFNQGNTRHEYIYPDSD
jgi:hypothetical protein